MAATLRLHTLSATQCSGPGTKPQNSPKEYPSGKEDSLPRGPKVVPFGDYLIGFYMNPKKELLWGPWVL